MATSPDGFVFKHPEHGLWVYQSRMLSRYRWLMNGQPPLMVSNSNIEQNTWLGYYITSAQALNKQSKADETKAAQQSIEMRLSRQVTGGFHEDVDITNFTQSSVATWIELEVESDFADPKEAGGRRMQKGRLASAWRSASNHSRELTFDYRVHHRYAHQGNTGVACLHRGIRLRIDNADSKPVYRKGRIRFPIKLEPHRSWHACLKWFPQIEGREMPIESGCHFANRGPREQKRVTFLNESASFHSPEKPTLTGAVIATLDQSKRDLAALRLYDLDRKNRGWTLAAGLPTYVGVFGRDALAASWEALMLSQQMCIGTLHELSHWQGAEINDWRDEQPGKIVHELHTNPLSVLKFDPHGRYYGGVTGAIYFGTVISGLWHWTGNKELVRPFVDTALKGLRWADEFGDLNHDGFCEYLTRSKQGEKNQGWKDSGDAIVYEDGARVPDPLATCEMQAFVYASKLHLSELLWWLGETETAKKLFHDAEELKKRFNDVFWMEDEGYFAMGLDAQGRQIRSTGSDPGHCLASGIVDTKVARRVATRMMEHDLFSGWGIRTLSARHPAFDPYAYHRGTVWPVENAVFTLAFARYGLHEQMNRLAAAQFATASLFDYFRLPEVIAGHQRDSLHPFPAIYPKANWPQAWSASAPFTSLQAILGLYPYAPLNALLLDPHLPEWLPEISLRALQVGKAKVDIRFYRTRDGESDYEILEKRGRLHVLRQPSPWSLTAGWGERIRDAIKSLLPNK
jgi:glycogen debranching enzyme